MSELTPETAQPTPEAQPTVVPEEVSPEVFQQMHSEAVQGFPLETAAENEPTVPVENDPPADNNFQTRLDALQHTINNQQQTIANLSHSPQQPQPATPTVEEQIRTRNPEMSDVQAQWLAKEVSNIAGPMIQGVHDQVQYLSNRQTQTDQVANVTDFNRHVDRLMDNHKIEDGWTRKVMRHAIVNEGLERHGNAFSKDLATREFITLNNERLERAQATEESYVNDKQRTAAETPPVSGPVSTSTAVQGIRDQIRDPKNKGMDFRGDTMTDMVSGYLDALEKGTENALGGRKG